MRDSLRAGLVHRPATMRLASDGDIATLAAPAAAVSPAERTRTLRETLPPYRVILHNDEIHAQDEVVQALLASVPALSRDRAIEFMLEAHNTGRAEVLSCPLELAELYRERLQWAARVRQLAQVLAWCKKRPRLHLRRLRRACGHCVIPCRHTE